MIIDVAEGFAELDLYPGTTEQNAEWPEKQSCCRRLKPAWKPKQGHVDAGLKRLCREWCRRSAAHDSFSLFRALRVTKLCRRYATRRFFPLHPALRLRLRAGLGYAVPPALDFARSIPPMQARTEFRNSLLCPQLTSSRRVAASLAGYFNCLFHPKTVFPVATQSLKSQLYPNVGVHGRRTADPSAALRSARDDKVCRGFPIAAPAFVRR